MENKDILNTEPLAALSPEDPVVPPPAETAGSAGTSVSESEDDARILGKQKKLKRWLSALFVAVIVCVLIFTAYNDFFASDAELPAWEDVTGIFSRTWFWLLFALLSLGGCFFFKGFRLSYLCRRLTGKWHFRTCMETGVVGHYYNYVTPLAIGGQPFEIYYLSSNGVTGGVAASLPIATFFLNQLAFALLAILSLVLVLCGNLLALPDFLMSMMNGSGVVSILAGVGVFLGLFMPLLTVLFSMTPKIGASLVRFVIGIGKRLRIVRHPEETTRRTIESVTKNAECLKTIATDPRVFAGSFTISLLEQISLYSIPYFTLRFFGYASDAPFFAEWFGIIALCLIFYSAISFIPTPGNSGAADLSFYLLFETCLTTTVGVGGLAFPAMVTWRLLCYYSFVVIGAVFLRVKNAEKKKSEAHDG